MERNCPVVPIFPNVRTTSRGMPKIVKFHSGKSAQPEFLVEWKVPMNHVPLKTGKCSSPETSFHFVWQKTNPQTQKVRKTLHSKANSSAVKYCSKAFI